MNTILVPTNFLPASFNAAQYALAMAEELNIETLILYNVYQQLITDDIAMTNFIGQDAEELRSASEEVLSRFKQKLAGNETSSIQIKTVSDYNTIKPGIIDAAKEYKADFIVMSVTAAHDKIDVLITENNAVGVAKDTEVPVLMIPENATYKKPKRILFACDLKKVVQTTPVDAMRKILDETKAELFVLHVEASANDFDGKLTAETLMLDNLLGKYNPKYHFAADKHFGEAIDKFALDNNIDLIIMIPKKHGFFENLFSTSHTKQLAFHTHIPIISIHE